MFTQFTKILAVSESMAKESMKEPMNEPPKEAAKGGIFDSLGINLTSFIFYLVCFAITFTALYILLFKPLLKLINSRQEQIKDTITKEYEFSKGLNQIASDKEALQTSSYKEKNRAYEEGKQEGMEAKAKLVEAGNAQASSILDEARKEAESLKNNAKGDVEKEVLAMWQSTISSNLQGLTISQESQQEVMSKLLHKSLKD
jgi:F-type H+-transporting ATPase subunit b